MTDLERLRQSDLKHSFHPNTALAQHHQRGPRIMVDGQGVLIRDAAGKEYLDFTSGLLNCILGYGNEEVARAAYEQMCRLQFATSFNGVATEPLIRLAETVASYLPPELGRVLLLSTGSEAVEAAIKIARYVNRLEGRPDKRVIISRKYAYHGVTIGTVPTTDLLRCKSAAAPLPPGYLHMDAPYCYRCPFGKEYPGCGIECAWELERIVRREGPETIAAFLGEPVMQMAGALAPPQEYWPIIREICTRYQVFMIADEIVTGFGRTGEWFGMQHYGVWPDMMAVSKGLAAGFFPMSATIVHEEIYQRLMHAAPGAGLWHGFTMNGNPAGCAAALKIIELIQRQDLVTNARIMGRRLLDGLKRLPLVGEARGLGLLTSIELVRDAGSKEPFPQAARAALSVAELAQPRGLLLRVPPNRDDLVIAPPLIVTEAQIDAALNILDDCLTTFRS